MSNNTAKPRKYDEKDKRLEEAKQSVRIKTDKPLAESSIRKFIESTEGKDFKKI